MIKRISIYIAFVFLIFQCKPSDVDNSKLLTTDFSFMKEMNGKTYNEIIAQKPVVKDYLEFVLSPTIKDQAINVLKNESQALFLHEEIIPTLYTKDGNMAIVEWKSKLFVAYYDERNKKMHEYIDASINKPPSYIAFIQDNN